MYIKLYFIGIITNVIVAYGDIDGSIFKNVGNYMTKLNPKMKNREELKRIVRVLNGHLDDGDAENEDDTKQLNTDQAEDQVKQLKRLLGLLQRNYEHQIQYSKFMEKPPPRIYYIENPEIIEEFKNRLRSKDTSASSSSEVSDVGRNLNGDDSSNYRRAAIFEPINLASSENVNPLRNNPSDDDDRASEFSSQSLDFGPRYPDVHTNIEPKVSYKITRDKRTGITGNSERKREKGSKSNYNSKKKKQSDRIVANDREIENRYIEKDNGPRRQPRETPGSKLKINRDPAKVSDDERWGGRHKFKRPIDHMVRRPNKRYDKRSSSGWHSKAFGRTFIPFIDKKTIYEEDE